MTIETALVSYLRPLLAADGNISSTIQLYAHVAPQSAAYPFVTYSIVSTDVENFLNPGTRDFTEQAIELSAYTETASERAAIMDNVKSNLHGFSGNMGAELLNIRQSVLQSINTFAESDITGTDEQIYRAVFNITFFYNWS